MITHDFRCDECAKTFDAKGKLNRHVKQHSKPYQCNKCQRGFALRSDLERHVRGRHSLGLNKHACSVPGCNHLASRKDNLRQHHERSHPSVPYFREPTVPETSKILLDGEQEYVPNNITDLVHGVRAEDVPRSWNCELFLQAAREDIIAVLERQLRLGIDVDIRADDGSSALHCAARAGHKDVIRFLLHIGADLGAENHKKRSPLHEALIGGDLATVELLIQYGADLRFSAITEDSLGQCESVDILRFCLNQLGDNINPLTMYDILIAASKRGSVRTVNALLQLYTNDVDITDANSLGSRRPKWRTCSYRLDTNPAMRTAHSYHRQPLLYAAKRGHLEIVKLLVSHGVNINVTYYNMSPLWFAIERGHFPVFDYLLGLPDVDWESRRYGYVSLVGHAARHGRCQMVRVLLDTGKFSTETCDLNGRRPLHEAAEAGQQETVNLLLTEFGSNVRCMDTDGHTPLQLAAFRGHWGVVRTLLDHDAINTFRPASPEALPEKQADPLVVLRRLLHHEIFQDINTSSKAGGLLHGAIRSRQDDCIRLLLDHENIDVNVRGRHYALTPLGLAAELGTIEAVRLLLRHRKLDINKKSRSIEPIWRCRHETALEIAKRKHHDDIVELLLAHGAK